MFITYDKSIDAAYIYISNMKNPIVDKTDSFAVDGLLEFGTINIDFSGDKKIIGLEILNASKHLPESVLLSAKQI